MTAIYSGSHGSLYMDVNDEKNEFPGKPAARVRSWSMSQSMETLDVTSLQDTERNYRPGLRSYTGTADFYYSPSQQTLDTFGTLIAASMRPRLPDNDGDDTTFGNTAQSEAPVTYGLKLYMHDQDAGYVKDAADIRNARSKYIQIRCLITSMNISVSTGEVTGGSIGFQVIGAPLKVEA